MSYAALGAAAALADDPDQPHAAALLRAAATMIAQASGHPALAGDALALRQRAAARMPAGSRGAASRK
jgi:hypothetical protein